MDAFNSNYIGVSADLTVQSEQVCDTDHSGYAGNNGNLGNFDYAWDMIANSDTEAGGWMQSGYFRTYGTAFVTFSQVDDLAQNGAIHDVVGSTVNIGSTYHYWQQNSGGYWYSNVATTRLQSDETLNFNWSGYSQQFFNEVRYKSSDVPGTSSSPTEFTSIQIEKSNDTFINLPNPYLAGTNDDTSRWAGPKPTSSNSFNIWTS